MVGASREIEALSTRGRSNGKGSIANDLVRLQKSPASAGSPENVLIVMDGLEEFSLEPLQWVLENIVLMACCTITILGVMPWLNIPLFSKTWSDIWAMDIEDLLSATEKNMWKNDMKYQKVQELIDICRKFGVVPQLKREMGYPSREVVINQITSNRATLVVFDRHHDQKNIEYYSNHVPCNMVRMNEEGEMDLIKGRSHLDNYNSTPSESTTSIPPSPRLVISETWKKILKLATPERQRNKENKF
ncbi:hypothetical protein LguiA_015332 [Lonicera macranthoides]